MVTVREHLESLSVTSAHVLVLAVRRLKSLSQKEKKENLVGAEKTPSEYIDVLMLVVFTVAQMVLL